MAFLIQNLVHTFAFHQGIINDILLYPKIRSHYFFTPSIYYERATHVRDDDATKIRRRKYLSCMFKTWGGF